MNTTVESADSSRSLRKLPWAALGVLGVAALAVGAAVVHIQTRPVEPHLVVLPDSEPASPETASPSSPYHAPSVEGTQSPKITTDTVKIGKPLAHR